MKKSEVTLMGGIDNNGLTRNNNSKKIILDLCGGTGSWSKPYKEAG